MTKKKELGRAAMKGATAGVELGAKASTTAATGLVLGAVGGTLGSLAAKAITRGFPGLISKIFF